MCIEMSTIEPSNASLSEEKQNEKEFALEEVQKHVSRDDCWLIIGGRVFDVSTFINDHPGGPALLIDNGGRDATSEFEAIGHTRSAHVFMKDKLLIGRVKGAEVLPWEALVPAPTTIEKSSSSLLIPFLVVLIALLFAVLGGHLKIPGLEF